MLFLLEIVCKKLRIVFECKRYNDSNVMYNKGQLKFTIVNCNVKETRIHPFILYQFVC